MSNRERDSIQVGGMVGISAAGYAVLDKTAAIPEAHKNRQLLLDVIRMAFNNETVNSPMRLNFIQRLPAIKTVVCLTSLMLTLIPGFSGADDTEIFFGRNSAQPNILFILDVSGSMDSTDEGQTGTRLTRLQTALTALLQNSNNINVGLFTYRGQNVQPHHSVTPITEDGHREAMISTINGLTANDGTPTVLALHEGKKYFRGEDTYVSPVVSECQSNHIVLLTDGEPSANETTTARATLIKEELGITECEGVGTVGFPEGGACGADLANHLATNSSNAAIPNSKPTIVHTIGFELGDADTWLTSVSAQYGTHSSADSAQSLLDAFRGILEVVEQETNTFVTPAISVDRFTGLSHRDDVYIALFKPSASSYWDGNLKRYAYKNTTNPNDPPRIEDRVGEPAVDPATGSFFTSAKSWWSDLTDGDDLTVGGAAHNIDSDDRRVYTQLIGNDLTTNDNKVHEGNTKITVDLLDVAVADRTDILQWTRGVDVLDYDEDATTTTRKQIGDPLHSQPVTINYDKWDSAVFFGTNQGYLHAIDSESGEELFSFIPQDLLSNLETFYSNESRVSKLYGLDGDITSWVTDENRDGIINDDDHAYLYIGMRRGGKNYYALDVTDKDNPKHLWTIRGGADAVSGVAIGDETTVRETLLPDLGQSWSKPTLANLMIDGTKTKVLIFGGGYDPLQDNATLLTEDNVGRALFIVDATTGENLWMETQATNADMKYSIPSDPAVVDIDSDGIADQLYVGDMGGQLWRYDFNRTAIGDLAQGGVIANFGDATNPRKFFYKPDLALIKHTHGNFLSVSIGSGNRANPLSESTTDRFYMVKQRDILRAPEGYGIQIGNTNNYRPITEEDLHDATNNDVQSTTDLTAANDALQELQTEEGWFIKLLEPGEKVLAHSLTINEGINFSTYLPSEVDTTDPCSPALGKSRLYRVQAFDAIPTKGTSRFTNNNGGGLPPPANLFFSENGEIYIQQGTRTVDSTDLDRVIRTHWAEQSE